ncbi:hypothetical protein [Janthinobacterium fluminis]|uniref:HTH cro/C1-type domain-containing protein n=1 Tax=Janthinobacterium fluminis TaxID=2987524 RepID=A0ABT5JZR3_9BURK|nr:hypothetical protein [Janthinobacterium fluminis]MDC8758225.1 hypothetical protein [Janthinobacterium fluminis]
MHTAANYRSSANSRIGTGGSFGYTREFNWPTAAAVTAQSTIGTGSEPQPAMFRQNASQFRVIKTNLVEAVAARNSAQDLARIRQVLSPAVSDLANTLGVTRQSIYNWLNGEAIAEENALKLRDLAQAADVLSHAGVSVNSTLLKRKFASGKTLLQVAQSGASASDAAAVLIQVLRRESEQRERLSARFEDREKIPPTVDFDLPSAG